jgi:hypothetical protein
VKPQIAVVALAATASLELAPPSYSQSLGQMNSSSAAYCLQFKDYDQQQQCIDDSAQQNLDKLDEKCNKFQSRRDKQRCQREFISTQVQSVQGRPSPYCLPITIQQMAAIRRGQRILVRGVDGCSQQWN